MDKSENKNASVHNVISETKISPTKRGNLPRLWCTASGERNFVPEMNNSSRGTPREPQLIIVL